MTRKEIISILAVLRAAFPNFYRDMGRKELEGIVSLWEDLFRDDPANLVCGAVKALIATKENSFPPTIGEVKAKMQKILSPHEMTEQEAWALVSKALTNGYYGAKEEFANFLPQCKLRWETRNSYESGRLWTEQPCNPSWPPTFSGVIGTRQSMNGNLPRYPRR